MHITEITVSYGETQSLPEYSNTKPSLTLTAVLDDGDDPAAAEAELWTQAKNAVREQVDQALEANNIPAKYSTEPRYQVLRTRTVSYYDRGKVELPKLVAIIPNDAKLDDRFVHAGYLHSRKLRYGHALRLAAETAEEGYTLVDCADGDMGRLMVLLPEEVAEEPPAQQHPIDAYAADAEPDVDFDEDEDDDQDDDQDE